MPLLGILFAFVPVQERVDFAEHVLPVLESRCIACHGAEKQKAGLRLDNRAAALAGSAFGERAVIVPGSRSKSELYVRIATGDELDRMPASGDPLTPEEVERLGTWIDEGAVWPDALAGDEEPPTRHWAYVAPQEPEPPEVAPEHAAWIRTPLDRFVAARLRDNGLEPSPAADRATLLRRASLDLTGLPPSVEEVAAFVADERPDAWERCIDDLLEGPAYAEHQARHWLDLARYADSQGYEKDDRRTMWLYRDWVIHAFARDLPFDRFTVEQIAGDLLPGATTDQLVATGFHRNTMVNREGGADPEEFRVAAVVDRVDTTASVWLGSTVGCARCHDHKFDPFRQREYYELSAFFDGTEDTGDSEEPTIEVPTPELRARREVLLSEIDELESVLSTWTDERSVELEAWIGDWLRTRPTWTSLRPDSARALQGSRLEIQDDDSVLAVGDVPDRDDYVLELALRAGAVESHARLGGLRLEVLTDPSLPEGGPGRPGHRNLVVSELEVSVVDADGGLRPVPIARALADFAQPGYAAERSIDGATETGWALGGGEGRAHKLILVLEEPLQVAPDSKLLFTVAQHYGGGHLVGRLRVSATAANLTPLTTIPPPDLEERLASREAPDEDVKAWFLATTPSLADARERIGELRRRVPPVPTALVLRERAEPRQTHVLDGGNFLSPLEPVEPGVPAVLHDLEPVRGDGTGRPDRLDLARWLVSRENPLTARVFVNRLWGRLFGTGLVATESDFGTQGDLPTHPALLDWLALRFQQDWSVKELHRTILRSATYRQSARTSGRAAELDPSNRWLARSSRFRLEAEVVRDVALSAAGLLADVVGGPSVFPPQPEGTWAMTYSADRWNTSTGPDRFRRGLYTFWRRTAPYPTFQLFDAPSRELVCTRRVRSNTPLQALAALNDPVFLEAAGGLAHRMLEVDAEDDVERLRHGFARCVSRRPTETEAETLLRLLERERAEFLRDPDRAAELVGAVAAACPGLLGCDPGGSDPGGCDPVEVAAWTLVANVLLNLDETSTRG